MTTFRFDSLRIDSKWVAVLGKFGALFTALAMVIAVFVGQAWFLYIAASLMGFIMLNIGANFYMAVSTETFQWGATRTPRSEKPLQYLLFVAAMAAAFLACLGVAGFLAVTLFFIGPLF